MITTANLVMRFGAGGIGKITLLRILMDDLESDHGEIKWPENTKIGYFTQAHSSDLNNKLSLFGWMK